MCVNCLNPSASYCFESVARSKGSFPPAAFQEPGLLRCSSVALWFLCSAQAGSCAKHRERQAGGEPLVLLVNLGQLISQKEKKGAPCVMQHRHTQTLSLNFFNSYQITLFCAQNFSHFLTSIVLS